MSSDETILRDIVKRQQAALKKIRWIMAEMNGCLDYLDVLGKIDQAVAEGLGERTTSKVKGGAS